MKWIDNNEAKGQSRFAFFAALFTALIASESQWRQLVPPLTTISDRPIIPPEPGAFFVLCSLLMLAFSMAMWAFRRRLQLTADGVRHFPFVAYRLNDYHWNDVASWGYQTTLEPDENNNDVPITVFYVTLKNGKTIVEPGFSTDILAEALHQNVGKPIHIDVNP